MTDQYLINGLAKQFDIHYQYGQKAEVSLMTFYLEQIASGIDFKIFKKNPFTSFSYPPSYKIIKMFILRITYYFFLNFFIKFF